MKKLSQILLLLSFVCSLSAQEIKHKSYLEFNGTNQYLSIEKDHAFKQMEEGDMTITLWFKGDRTITYAATQRLLSSLDEALLDKGKANAYEILTLKNTKNNFLGLRNSNLLSNKAKLVQRDLNLSEAKDLNDWHYLAYIIDRTNKSLRVELDGKEELSRPIEGNEKGLPSANKIFIAAVNGKNGTYAHFGGKIDNLRFYKKALSRKEVLKDMMRYKVTAYTPYLFAGFDFYNYKAGDSIIKDVTGHYTAKLHNFPKHETHELIKSYTQHSVNGNLIGRGRGQALGVFTLGLTYPNYINSLSVNLTGNFDSNDIKALRLYATDNGDRYDMRQQGALVAETYNIKEGLNTLKYSRGSAKVDRNSKLWLVAEVSNNAKEGHKLQAEVKEILLATANSKAFKPQAKPFTRQEIVLSRQLVWTPKENGSAHYRIPALIYLDNGYLVASIDKRKHSEYDLPEDIDVEVKISKDLGKTWSNPITVAKGEEGHGFGDAAMATDGKNIYMVMVAGSGLWYYPSHAKKPLEMFFSKSTDGGYTWSKPREISQEVYTDRYPNGGFFGSGNGIVMKNGRIAFVAAMRTDSRWGGNMDNVVVYSDDKGITWQSSSVVRHNGDESKIEELADGRLLVSCRNRLGGANARTFVFSNDGGQTWEEPQTWRELMGNACNAGLRRYTKGYEHKSWAKGKEQWLLHTLPSADRREKLRIYLSQDNGKTWSISQEICHGEAVYSEITVLPDGTIAVIAEENDRPGFDIYFTRITIDWLLSGEKDHNYKNN